MKRAAFVIAMAVVSGVAPSSARADATGLRWSRPIQASEGWTRVILPDDVVAACRPGLPDVRVRSGAGVEVPFVVEQSLGGLPTVWPVRNVESVPGRETTAIVDRGAHPAAASEATIEVDAQDFLKPVVLEASDDAQSWKEIARGSIFGTASGRARARMGKLRFALNDRRYWRLRLDDRNGPPVPLHSVITSAPATDGSAPRELALDLKRTSSEGGESTYELDLPSANLAVSSLRLTPAEPAFVRPVTVSERVVVRDEITRRAVGSGTLSRGPGGESLSVLLGELRGPALEIRIDDGASPALTIPAATATIAPRSILFFTVGGAMPLSLDYGSPVLDAARFDLAAALARGRPDPVNVAPLGPVVDHGASSPVGLPPHGLAVDESRWQTKAAIDLPGGGGVAYLPLEGIDAWGGLRIVDATSHEVPYLFERTPHHARQAVVPAIAQTEGRTVVTLSDLSGLRETDAIELTATAPAYFTRGITVVESTRDARGPVGERVLGSATWERRPGDTATPLTIAIAAPTQSTIEVRIDNGSNPALTLGAVTVERSVRRVDFVCAAGESLALLTGNPAAGAPSYDLALLADALLAVPAAAAHLEPARDIAPVQAGPAKWFWVAVIVAGLGVAAALARALGAPKKA